MTTPVIGFAALWEPDRERTWSYIPHHVLAAMSDHGCVVDLDIELDTASRWIARGLGARMVHGRRVTLWRSLGYTDRVVERKLRRSLDSIAPDVVMQIADIATPGVPFVTYRDVYWGQLEGLLDEVGDVALLGHPGFTRERLRQRRIREDAQLRTAAATATFSHWSASYLVDDLGLDPATVHVVRPGMNAIDRGDGSAVSARERSRPRSRLLYVGVDFARKGGSLLVEAFRIARSRRPDVTLTIAGPTRWPLSTPPPVGIDFVGRIPLEQARTAFETHDLFVMPSVFEPYGIAFLEAQAQGLPCIGPAAFAGPEVIEDGRTGRLLASRDPDELATLMIEALEDDDLHASVAALAPTIRRENSWDRTGRELVRICEAINTRPMSTTTLMTGRLPTDPPPRTSLEMER